VKPMNSEIINQAVQKILKELDDAEKVHPDYPSDVIYQTAIMVEEAGESMRAALHVVYEGGTIGALEKELIQTAAMCIRQLEFLGGLK
jgi:hypothetical protein